MNKNFLLMLALATPLLTLGAGCAANNQGGSGDTVPSAGLNSPMVDATNSLAVSAVIEPGVIAVKTNTGVVVTTPTKNYVAALALYGKSGARFQFANCSGIPGSLHIKRNTKFMIDNRDNKSHAIGIGAKAYQLAAYDFAIVSVQTVGTFNITCDGGGSAQVGVEN